MTLNTEDGSGKGKNNGVLSLTKQQDENVKSYCGVFGDIRVFVGLVFCMRVLSSIVFSASVSNLTTVERRYSFSSAQLGVLQSISEIVTLCTIPFVTFFLGKPTNNRPRWVGFAISLSAISAVILSLPQLVSQEYHYDKAGNTSSTSQLGLCYADGANETECDDSQLLHSDDSDMAYQLFVIARLIEGFSSAFTTPLSYSYIDDFSGKRSSVYIGLLDAAFGIGTPLGFGLIAPACLTVYVDFNRVNVSEINIDDTDPRWVGAWWLPSVVMFPLFIPVAILLFFFPKSLPTDGKIDNNTRQQQQRQQKPRLKVNGILAHVKDLLKSAFEIVKNPVFMIVVVAVAINSPVGFVLFMPKYFQKDLGFTASMGNMIMGFLWLFPHFPMGLTMGFVIKKLKLGQTGLARLILAVVGLIVVTNCLVITLPCEGPYFEGTKAGQTVNEQCNVDCDCTLEHYQPVCGSDGFNYYSPCYAGCTTAVTDKNFTNCHCVETQTENPSDTFAYDGLCPTPRSVYPDQKSFALGLKTVISAIITVAFPIIAGEIIDATCILWRQECGEQGACAQYDNYLYRVLFMGISATLSTVAFFMLIGLLFVLKKRANTTGYEARHLADADIGNEKIEMTPSTDGGRDNPDTNC
ncbi:solute carrier organic anion transporter family member 3A1-like [Glandiceps talaboti]